MNTDQRRRLMKLLNVQSVSRNQEGMMNFMHDALEDAEMTVRRRDGQLYAVKGNTDTPVPVFVAHADTVHRVVAQQNYAVGVESYPDGDRLYYGYDPINDIERGVGGDDKCGLFVCLEAAREFDHCGVIITRDEEIGALGASCITRADLAHAAVLIQADRRGGKDAVRSTFGSVVISSAEWQARVQESVSAHGYAWCDSGLFTDVTRLHEDRIAQVSAINLSAGYYSPHMPSEYISEYDLEWALALSTDLAQLSAGHKWKHEHTPKRYVDDDVGGWRGRVRRERSAEFTQRWEDAFAAETDEDDLDSVAEARLNRHFGGVKYYVGNQEKWIFPDEEEDAIWEGLRGAATQSEVVLCEMPDCDNYAVVLDYDVEMWLCQECQDEMNCLDTENAVALAQHIKQQALDEPLALHMGTVES